MIDLLINQEWFNISNMMPQYILAFYRIDKIFVGIGR
jgi:hypothetical protein